MSETIIPSGTYKGRTLESLSGMELAAIVSEWSPGSGFYPRIVREVEKRWNPITGEAMPTEDLDQRLPEETLEEKRDAQIYEWVNETLGEMLDDSLYWTLPSGGGATWDEMRAAIMRFVFATEREIGREDEHGRHVLENCV